MDNSQVISRVYKVGYALTSYQDCPKCQQKVSKGDLNIINERVIKYAVVNKSIRQFYHFKCYDLKCFQKNYNVNLPIEQIEGYNELKEFDIKKFQQLINNLQAKLKSDPNEKLYQKTKDNFSLHQQSLKADINENNNSINITLIGKKQNQNSNNDVNYSNQTQTSLLQYTNQKQGIVNQDFFQNDKHSKQNVEKKTKQQTLTFKTNDANYNISKQTIQDKGCKVNNKSRGEQDKILQQKIDIFQYDKKQQKSLKYPQVLTKTIDNQLKNKINQESSDEEEFQPRNLIIRNNNQKLDTQNNDLNANKKIITTSEKIQQLLKNQDQQKEKAQSNLKDPKIKKKRLNNCGELGNVEKKDNEKTQQRFEQLDFDEFDSGNDYKSESIKSKNNKQMIPEDKEDKIKYKQIDVQQNNKNSNHNILYKDSSDEEFTMQTTKNNKQSRKDNNFIKIDKCNGYNNNTNTETNLNVKQNNQNMFGYLKADEFKYKPSKSKIYEKELKLCQDSINNKSCLVNMKDKKQKSKINYSDEDEDKEDSIQSISSESEFEYNRFNYLKQSRNKMEDENESFNKSQNNSLSQSNSKVTLLKKNSKLSTDTIKENQDNEQLELQYFKKQKSFSTKVNKKKNIYSQDNNDY